MSKNIFCRAKIFFVENFIFIERKNFLKLKQLKRKQIPHLCERIWRSEEAWVDFAFLAFHVVATVALIELIALFTLSWSNKS